MFKLVIQDDEGKTTVVPLIRDEITIGRKEGNTIRLTERNVSRKHAKISRANGAVAIEDLGSYNGVKVNGTRIMQKVTLSISDRVQIGDYLIELKAEGAEQPASASYDDARTTQHERLDPSSLGGVTPQAPMQPGSAAAAEARRQAVLAAVAAVSAPAPSTPARLVVLSSNFPGREFQLTKVPAIIGRTEDNDIVINHKSISRAHATITRDDAGRYSIADMNSANGVRVNGEDYGKVELRRGDLVDLGHIRMRFVEPGEAFVFGRDAQVMDVPTKGKKTWLWGVLGAGVVGAIIVVVVAGGGSKGKSKGDALAAAGPGTASPSGPGTAAAGAGSSGSAMVTGLGSETGPGSGSVAAPTIDAGEAAVATGPTPGVDTAAVNQALADAKAAVAASDWDKASDKAEAALKLDPVNADARALFDQAVRESSNEKSFKTFTDAAAASPKDFERAVHAFEKISTDSVYKNQAREAYDRLHDEFIASRVTYGKTLAKQKKCAELKKLANISGNTFPDARTELDKLPCDDQLATGPGPDHTPGPGSSHEVTPPPGPASGKPAAEQLNDASAAASAGQYGRALSLAESAMGAKDIDSTLKAKAVTLAGLAACNTKNAAKAKKYYGMSPAGRQTLLRQACLKQGIELQD